MRPGDVRRLILALDTSRCFAVPAGELSIALLGAKAMGRLHEQFMGDPAPTDVITFEGDPALGVAGEICVCVDVAAAHASAHGGDFAAELTLYLVHGYLHLAGYDDHTAAQRRSMRAAERRALEIVRRAGALPVLVLG